MQSLDYLSQNELLYEELVAKAKQDLMQMDGEIVRIDKAELLKMEALEAFLFECISPYGFKGPLLQSIIIALKSNPGAVFYSTAYRLTINRDILEIEPVKQYGNRSQFTINKEDTVMYTPIGLTLSSIIIGPEFEIVKSRDIIYLDLDLLKFPLIVRKWKDGDRFVPFGMKGSKLVSDFFIDLHFTRHQKEDCWLLCDADDSILWVIGHRSDDIYKINENTQQVLKIQLVQ
jgi:tRNA(Ile)-lysidine synthase